MLPDKERIVENKLEELAQQATGLMNEIGEIYDDMDQNIDLDWPDDVDPVDVDPEDIDHYILKAPELANKCDKMIQQLLYLRSVVVSYDQIEDLYGEL